GAAADQEQLRAEIQWDQARTELAGFERELAIARQELAILLGRPDLKETPVAGALAETPDNRLLDQGPEQWLARHPSVVAARTSRDRMELELKRARLEPYPDVTLGVDGGREGLEDAAIVEFRVGLPLPLIDRSKGRKQEAQANVGVAQGELAAAEQRLLRAWGIASRRFRTATEQVATYRDRILPKATTALRLVQTGFQEGKFGFIDLLDTQRTTSEARLAYQQKLLELNVAQAELQALVAPPPGAPQTTQPLYPPTK
ncbi:MAG TPA: TolC family protein, partial [Candidatus Sulfotelmatobacter sp.]|nr:TolC family protein [Candidatus Sulfotelmatobacter sp.]